ncbi:MAG: hypothetical protein MUC99_00145, partial [Anaerolineae bacterium]|nr:hypothetical protein [Anaerolineae bacterium]
MTTQNGLEGNPRARFFGGVVIFFYQNQNKPTLGGLVEVLHSFSSLALNIEKTRTGVGSGLLSHTVTSAVP